MYVTQVKARPPTFHFYVNHEERFKENLMKYL